MPTYEYRCEKCEARLEVFASMSAPAPEKCEECGAVGSLVKVLFAPAVHYKGSGFYATDYAGTKPTATASSSSSDGSTSRAASSSSESSGSGSDSGSSSSSSSSESKSKPSSGAAASSSD